MATPPILDFDTLLKPISEAQPAGPDFRTNGDLAPTFRALRDARKKAVNAERQLADFWSKTEAERVMDAAPDPPDWATVRQLSQATFGQSKDLWVAAWLIEALTRLNGFAGLRDGVQLANQLCERFWEHLHPQADQREGLTLRFAQLAGLDGGSQSDGTLIGPLARVPMTMGDGDSAFSLVDYRDALELQRKPADVRQRREGAGAVTLAAIDAAAAVTPAAFFAEILADVKTARDALTGFDAFLRAKQQDYKGPPFVPSSSKIREVLDECSRACRSLAKDKLASLETTSPERTGGGVAGGNAVIEQSPAKAPPVGRDTDMTNVPNSAITSRQEAFQRLSLVQEYFRRTEPHSPISYALEQVIRWGEMSLPELLGELIRDNSAREEIFKRTGIVLKSTDK